MFGIFKFIFKFIGGLIKIFLIAVICIFICGFGLFTYFIVDLKNDSTPPTKEYYQENIDVNFPCELTLKNDFYYIGFNYGYGYYVYETSFLLDHENLSNLNFKIDRSHENKITNMYQSIQQQDWSIYLYPKFNFEEKYYILNIEVEKEESRQSFYFLYQTEYNRLHTFIKDESKFR